MAESGNEVVLCKGASENEEQEPYVKTLESAGYKCKYLQTLQFEFVNMLELQTCLSISQKCAGLILTSPRAVEAIAMATKDNTDILQPWKHMPAYCVGPKTAAIAKTQLDLQGCIGSECGNAEKLAEKIVLDIEKNSKPLLYPCSQIARETIFNILKTKKILVIKLVVYKTLENESLGQNLLEFLKKSSNVFVFFSPSTVEHVANQLKKNSYDIKAIKAIAIGPTTRDALNNLDFNVYATAEKPEPAALMQVIKAVGKDIKKSEKTKSEETKSEETKSEETKSEETKSNEAS